MNTQKGNNGKPLLLKVVILGNGGVGKSCLMNRFVRNEFDKVSYHTVGVEFLNKEVEYEGKTYCLQIWDTAGQERFKSLRTPFYRGSDICILTYSIADLQSFKDISVWQHEFLHYAEVPKSDMFPFIVIGNKCDIPIESRQVEEEEAAVWCKEKGFSFVETSAKDAVNVEEAFHMALKNWVLSDSKLSKTCIPHTVNLNKPVERKGCC